MQRISDTSRVLSDRSNFLVRFLRRFLCFRRRKDFIDFLTNYGTSWKIHYKYAKPIVHYFSCILIVTLRKASWGHCLVSRMTGPSLEVVGAKVSFGFGRKNSTSLIEFKIAIYIYILYTVQHMRIIQSTGQPNNDTPSCRIARLYFYISMERNPTQSMP